MAHAVFRMKLLRVILTLAVLVFAFWVLFPMISDLVYARRRRSGAPDDDTRNAPAIPSILASSKPERPCDMSRTFRALGALGVTSAGIRGSVAHAGSTTRHQRLIDRLKQGTPIKIASMGGSVTVGVGLYNSTSLRYYDHLFQWMRQSFPSNVTQSSAAINAVGSGYWRYCFPQHLETDADLILLDVALNDAPAHLSALVDHALNEEKLLRAILSLPNRPAVVLVAFPSNEYINAQETLHSLAVNYDLPLISMRDMLQSWLAFGQMTHASFRAKFYDPNSNHPNDAGHELVDQLLVHFFQTQVLNCDKEISIMDQELQMLPSKEAGNNDSLPDAIAFVAPRTALTAGNVPSVRPLCLTTYTNPQLTLETDSKNSTAPDDWRMFATEGGRKMYWRTTVLRKPGAFRFNVPWDGTVVYLSSLKAGYLNDSVAECWVRNNEWLVVPPMNISTTMVTEGRAHPELNFGMNTLLGKLRGPAAYSLWCQLVSGIDFRIIGLLGD